MGIFNKIFGNNKASSESKPDIDSLIKSDDTDKLLMDLDTYISELCNYGNSIDKLTDPQKNFYFNQCLEREINNGGFDQFFHNSSGAFSQETILSLKELGAFRTALILEKAVSQFPNSIVPKDQTERQNSMELVEETACDVWNELDTNFYEYEDNLSALNIEYIKKNRSFF